MREVKYYLCAADAVVQPYRHATQSGVTPLAYHFEKPMIVSNVGSFAEQVLHEQTGLVTGGRTGISGHGHPAFLRIRRTIFYSSSSQRKEKIFLEKPGEYHSSNYPMIYRSKAPFESDWPAAARMLVLTAICMAVPFSMPPFHCMHMRILKSMIREEVHFESIDYKTKQIIRKGSAR